MMCFASADRDPSQFSDPDHFDVTRENAELHLQFGKGPHFCLGAALGRLEVRIVLELLTTLTPNLALLPDQAFEYSPKVTGRVLEALMVCPNVASRDT
jgi:cytochrome P450